MNAPHLHLALRLADNRLAGGECVTQEWLLQSLVEDSGLTLTDALIAVAEVFALAIRGKGGEP